MNVNTGGVAGELNEVVWPLGRQQQETVFTDRLGDLNGKTIALVWSYMWNSDVAFAVVREELKAKFPDIRFVLCDKFGDTHGVNENEVVADWPRNLKEHGVDGVILFIANCRSCTPAVLRTHLACERAGFPPVSIVREPFIEQATAVAEHLGVENAAMAVDPGHMATDPKETYPRKRAQALPQPIVTGLITSEIGSTVGSDRPSDATSSFTAASTR